MNKVKVMILGLLLCLPTVGCADSVVDRKNMLLDSGDILVIAKNKSGRPVASYISTVAVDKKAMAERILKILNLTKTSQKMIKFVESRIQLYPQLNKQDFNLSLTGYNDEEYRFTYTSDFEKKLYILNYQYLGVPKS